VDADGGARTPFAGLAGYRVASVEQPLPPGSPETLARLRAESPIPLVLDESVVTPA
jgi:L-alanine-DL-glutamate epimerase-like enolase superfamily enzyme